MKKINVIGHFGSSSGLGNTTRLFIDVLISNGFCVVGLDVDYHSGVESTLKSKIPVVTKVDDLPDGLNLIVVAIQLLPVLWLRRFPGLLHPRFINVGLVFWELAVVPQAWKPSLQLFDAIIVCSHFVRQALEVALPTVPTIYAEHPLQLNIATIRASNLRSSLGLLDSDFVVMSSFDLRSDFSRKNPLAVLDAFELAFPDLPEARLVIKANGAQSADKQNSVVARILARAQSDRRIVLISKTLPYEEVMALYMACDVYISLHRAEGLGLGPMEAMAMGKLVIATGYSGNMTYMTQQNSVPVTYKLIEPAQTGWQYRKRFVGEGAAWAEADQLSAVRGLQMAFDQPEQRLRLSQEAQRNIADRQQTSWAGGYFDEMLTLAGGLAAPDTRKRKSLSRKIAMQEVLNATLRRKNAQALFERIFN